MPGTQRSTESTKPATPLAHPCLAAHCCARPATHWHGPGDRQSPEQRWQTSSYLQPAPLSTTSPTRLQQSLRDSSPSTDDGTDGPESGRVRGAPCSVLLRQSEDSCSNASRLRRRWHAPGPWLPADGARGRRCAPAEAGSVTHRCYQSGSDWRAVQDRPGGLCAVSGT